MAAGHTNRLAPIRKTCRNPLRSCFDSAQHEVGSPGFEMGLYWVSNQPCMAFALRALPVSDIVLAGSRFSCEMGLFGVLSLFPDVPPEQMG